MAIGQNWEYLPDDMRECLEMIAHKVGRILNGDPDYIDSWTDIIGYTRLVEKRLIDEQSHTDGPVNQVSIGEKLAGVKTCKDKPSPSEITKALNILLDAGVITEA